jgi:hypothetical protein
MSLYSRSHFGSFLFYSTQKKGLRGPIGFNPLGFNSLGDGSHSTKGKITDATNE